jgi:hypothetical protein
MIVMRETLRRLPAEGTKGRKKLEAIVRLDRPREVEKREPQDIDGGGG